MPRSLFAVLTSWTTAVRVFINPVSDSMRS
jgi:hypothetical protein